jgi:hypothetical protein
MVNPVHTPQNYGMIISRIYLISLTIHCLFKDRKGTCHVKPEQLPTKENIAQETSPTAAEPAETDHP